MAAQIRLRPSCSQRCIKLRRERPAHLTGQRCGDVPLLVAAPAFPVQSGGFEVRARGGRVSCAEGHVCASPLVLRMRGPGRPHLAHELTARPSLDAAGASVQGLPQQRRSGGLGSLPGMLVTSRLPLTNVQALIRCPGGQT